MGKYIFKRVLMALLTIFVTVTITFIISHSIPGDPLAKEGNMPPGVYENLQRYYNLDKPLIVQYGIYLKNLLQFDLGPSLKSANLSVNDQISMGFPVTLALGAQAFVVAIILGFILGVLAALYHNKWPDYLSMILAIIGISVPSFIMAYFLMDLFSVKLMWLPAARWGTWRHTILPTVALAAMPTAFIARLMRSSMLEVLGSDYIKTAKAKGLKQNVIIIKHAIRNAVLPVVSVLGIIATNLVTGSFVIERIFAIPGIGDLFVKSILNRDYPAILGTTVFYSVMLIFIVLIVDLLYTFIDPRIKLGGVKSAKPE